jgi:hypothetical protein
MKHISRLATFVVAMFFLYACQKEADFTGPALSSKQEGIEFIKKQFISQHYEAELFSRFNDSTQLYWRPTWENYSQTTTDDSTLLYYIPLQPTLQSVKTGKLLQTVKAMGMARYIMVRSTRGVVKFYLAYYMAEPADSSNSSSQTSDGELNFTTFSGTLTMRDLAEEQVSGYLFLNGKSINPNPEAFNPNARNNAIACKNIEYCWWQRNCTNNFGVEVQAIRTSGEGSCPYPTTYNTSYGCPPWTRTETTVEQVCWVVDEPPPPPTSGGGGTGGSGTFYPTPTAAVIGNRPISEFLSKCDGITNIWSNYPNNEVQALVTESGNLLVVAVLSYGGGSYSGLYQYGAKTYYVYPMSQGAPAHAYSNVQTSGGNYYIPVVAAVHTHTPCRTDGTNGVSQPVSAADVAFANKFTQLNHWVIGCGVIARYGGSNPNYYDVQSGSLSTLCTNIR